MHKGFTQPVISIEPKAQIWEGNFGEKMVKKSKFLLFRETKLFESKKFGRIRISK